MTPRRRSCGPWRSSRAPDAPPRQPNAYERSSACSSQAATASLTRSGSRPCIERAGPLIASALYSRSVSRCSATRRRAGGSSAPVARYQVFLISIKAGGAGLNLTAADYVFLLDPWWNPAVEAKAIDRAHRIGRTRPVHVYRVLTEETVEAKVVELQERKRALAGDVLSGAAKSASGIGRSDLGFLLGV